MEHAEQAERVRRELARAYTRWQRLPSGEGQVAGQTVSFREEKARLLGIYQGMSQLAWLLGYLESDEEDR